jgi:hypothetical protein
MGSHFGGGEVLPVLDLVSQVRDVVLMSVYLELGNRGGGGILG